MSAVALPAAAQRLHDIWSGGGICPICNANAWELHDDAVELRVRREPGRAVPASLVICKSCGHIHLFVAKDAPT